MDEMPKVLFDGNFKIEKIQPTFARAQEIFNIVDAQREFLGKWLDWVDNTNSPEDMFLYIYKASEVASKSYKITVDNKIIGSISFVRGSVKHKTAEIGYWLSHDFNGRGIMTRAVREMEKFAFEQMGMNRVEIRVDTENRPSQAVAVRCGYVKEAVLREAFVLRGKPCDEIIFAKLKSEWEKENKNA